MSFLKTLGKVGSFLPLIGPAIGAVSGALGKQQGGKGDALVSQANVQQGQDRNAIGLYQAQQNAQNQAGNLDLERKDFTNKNRSVTARQALLAHLLGEYAPVGVPGIPQASGGFAASLHRPDMQRILQTLGTQAETAQTTPLDFQGGNLIKAPSLTALPQMGKADGFLSTLARIGELMGAVSPYLKKPEDDTTGASGGYSPTGF